MKNNTKVKPFKIGLSIWFSEFINMVVFFALAFIVILISINILKIDLLSILGTYVKVFILVLAYIGIIMGAYTSYRSYSEYQLFIPKITKYYVALFQLIFFAIIGYIFYMFSIDVILFIGIYLIIFWEFALNTIFIGLNNIKYPKENKEKKTNDKNEKYTDNNNNSSNMIDIDLLK